ncbi:hypothetical protein [Haloarcula onubensis]|uniref:E3 ubiquitin ligase family protein n=1 Tax=Haloarcula onubensis TaxID=2950539 RepID=A0ABU2FUS0_9EURY|nr:hypothetical protein [Halomicroarcula sp. S3CR25-11]MDS0284514.1 E3 ubiquitin ligase family protein [Halomicroarcula sp. S3CR25-11]
MSTFLLVAGIVLLIIAGFAAVYGRRQHRKSALIETTETTDIRDIKEEGVVELKGTIRADEPFDSPIKGKESTLSAWEVEEWDERGDSEMWETRATGVYTTPFELDDGTGRVRVNIGDYVSDPSSGTGVDEIQLGPIDVDRFLANGVTVDNVLASLEGFSVETSVPPDAEPPERIETFIQAEAGVATQTDSITNILDFGNKHGERRYYEGTLSPSDDIYLLGEVRAAQDATYPLKPENVIVTVPDSGQLIISDKSEKELVDSFSQYKYAYVVTILAAVTGLVAVVIGSGML